MGGGKGRGVQSAATRVSRADGEGNNATKGPAVLLHWALQLIQLIHGRGGDGEENARARVKIVGEGEDQGRQAHPGVVDKRVTVNSHGPGSG